MRIKYLFIKTTYHYLHLNIKLNKLTNVIVSEEYNNCVIKSDKKCLKNKKKLKSEKKMEGKEKKSSTIWTKKDANREAAKRFRRRVKQQKVAQSELSQLKQRNEKLL